MTLPAPHHLASSCSSIMTVSTLFRPKIAENAPQSVIIRNMPVSSVQARIRSIGKQRLGQVVMEVNEPPISLKFPWKLQERPKYGSIINHFRFQRESQSTVILRPGNCDRDGAIWIWIPVEILLVQFASLAARRLINRRGLSILNHSWASWHVPAVNDIINFISNAR